MIRKTTENYIQQNLKKRVFLPVFVKQVEIPGRVKKALVYFNIYVFWSFIDQ